MNERQLIMAMLRLEQGKNDPYYCSDCDWEGTYDNLIENHTKCPECGSKYITRLEYGELQSNRDIVDEKINPRDQYDVKIEWGKPEVDIRASHSKKYSSPLMKDLKKKMEKGWFGNIEYPIRLKVIDKLTGAVKRTWPDTGGYIKYSMRFVPPYWDPKKLVPGDIVTLFADQAAERGIPMIDKTSPMFITKNDTFSRQKYKDEAYKRVFKVVDVDYDDIAPDIDPHGPGDPMVTIQGPFIIEGDPPYSKDKIELKPIGGSEPTSAATYKVPLGMLRGVNYMFYPGMTSIEQHQQDTIDGHKYPYFYPIDKEQYMEDLLEERNKAVAKAEAEGTDIPKLRPIEAGDIPRTKEEAEERFKDWLIKAKEDLISQYLRTSRSQTLRDIAREFPMGRRPKDYRGRSTENKWSTQKYEDEANQDIDKWTEQTPIPTEQELMQRMRDKQQELDEKAERSHEEFFGEEAEKQKKQKKYEEEQEMRDRFPGDTQYQQWLADKKRREEEANKSPLVNPTEYWLREKKKKRLTSRPDPEEKKPDDEENLDIDMGGDQ